MSRIAGILAVASLALAGCAMQPRPQLTPIGDAIPDGVSLSGRWQLRAEEDDSERRIREAEYKSGARKIRTVLLPHQTAMCVG